MSWKDFPNLYREGEIKYISAKDGRRLRTASWPSVATSKAIVVVINGHREYMEKYSEFISDLLSRDVAVYSMDNRGQGLSDRLLDNRQKSYVRNFDDFVTDLDQFMSEIILKDENATRCPLYLMGHSMGGHICLRYLHDHPGRFDKTVLLSPMMGVSLGWAVADSLVKKMTFLLCAIGLEKLYVPGQGSSFSRARHLMQMPLITHDKTRYHEEVEIIEEHPELYVGGATLGWLRAALESIRKIRRPGYLDRITLPLLTIIAGDEKLVNNRATEDLFDDCDNIELVTIVGARHEIYRELDQYRNILWQKIDDFLGLK